MELQEFDNFLHDAELKLKRLKSLYEQWFQGIERSEPTVPRKDLERLFVMLHKEKPRNTAARFRLAQLQASYNIYQSYWQRIARQIEEGTFERDVQKARRLRGAAEAARAKAVEIDIDEVDVEDEIAAAMRELAVAPAPAAPAPRPALSAFSPFAMKPGAKPAGPAAPPPAAPAQAKTAATFAKPKISSPPADPKPPAPPVPPVPPAGAKPAIPGLKVPKPGGPAAPPPVEDDRALRKFYDEYLTARKRNNEAVDHLRYEAVAESVKKMVSKLKEKHGDKKIGFEVYMQNGRVGFRPKIE